MQTSPVSRLADLKTAITLLKGRERSLQVLAQSVRCTRRPEAEGELGRVREEISATYARMRPLQEHG